MNESKRIYELDLARILIVLTLPFIHIMEFWGDMYGYADMLSQTSTNILNTVCEILCIFVAPTFMICMGIFMSFSRKSTPRDFFKRGVILLMVELALNIMRYEIPGLISLAFAKSEESKELVLESMRLGIINSDILTLAGLSFIVFALFKKLKLKPWAILLIATGLYAIDYVLNITVISSITNMDFNLSNLLGSFIYIDGNSTFPIMEWLMFISFGYYLGVIIKTNDVSRRNKIFGWTGITSAITFGVCLTVAILCTDNAIMALNKAGQDYSMSPLCLIGEISASILFISVIYWLYQLFHLQNKEKFNLWIARFSGNITYFYIIQWIIVGFGMMFGIALSLGSKVIPLWGVLLCYLAICVISYFAGDGLHLLTKKVFNTQNKKA